MTIYITHFVIIPLRVNNVVFGNACFSDNILLNCESMVRTQKLSEETFFTAQLVYIAMFLSQRTIPCYSIPHSDRQP